MSNAHGQRETRSPEQPGAAKPKQPWLWNVVLLNDEEHSYEYVIRMMQQLFGLNAERATRVAETVDKEGRAIIMTTHREHAELKREQIHGFGRDPQLAVSKGSMSSVIEPAEGT
jgi:ATP-dependent Clp protease adaptor protein ClpS